MVYRILPTLLCLLIYTFSQFGSSAFYFVKLADLTYSDGLSGPRPAKNVALNVGSSLHLNCTTKPDLTAPNNTMMISFHGRQDYAYNEREDDATLAIRKDNLGVKDVGTYSCLVNRRLLTSVYINIGYSPDLTNVSISCFSLDFNELSCNWTPQDFILPTEWTLYYYIGGGNATACLNTGGQEYGCHWPGRMTDDIREMFVSSEIYYVYLEARNNLGTATTPHLTVDPVRIVKPSGIKDIKVANIGHDSVELSWWLPDSLINGLTKVFNVDYIYNISYKSKWDQQWQAIPPFISGKQNVTYNVRSLTPNAKYTLRIWVKPNTSGFWSEYTQISATTEEHVPGDGPELTSGSYVVSSVSASQRNVVVYWQSLPERLHHGTITWYYLNVTDLTTQITYAETGIPTDLYKTLRGLSLHTSYYITIQAHTDVGYGPASSILIPEQDKVPPSPQSVTAETINSSHVSVSWQPGSGAPPTGFIVHYCEGEITHPDAVVVQCQAHYRWVRLLTPLARQHTIDVSPVFNLAANMQYGFGVSTVTGHRSSALRWSDCLYKHDGVPGKPQNLHSVAYGSDMTRSDCDGVCLRWDKFTCKSAQGWIVGYDISYVEHHNISMQTHSCDEGTITNITGHDVTSLTLTTLSPYTPYLVCVRAVTAHQHGAWSDRIRAVSAQAAPDDAPFDLDIWNITGSSAVISWRPSTVPNGAITSTHIYVKRPGRSILEYEQTDGLSAEYTLLGLDGYTNYTVSLVACNSAGCSPDSQHSSFMTNIKAPPVLDFELKPDSSDVILISWLVPDVPNGPVSDMDVVVYIAHDDGDTEEIRNQTFAANLSSAHLPVSCSQERSYPVNVSIQAINKHDTHSYPGPRSPTKTHFVCSPVVARLPRGIIAGIVMGSCAALLILLIIIFRCYKWQKPGKHNIQLPPEAQYTEFETYREDGYEVPLDEPLIVSANQTGEKCGETAAEKKLVQQGIHKLEETQGLISSEHRTGTIKHSPVSVDSGRDSLDVSLKTSSSESVIDCEKKLHQEDVDTGVDSADYGNPTSSAPRNQDQLAAYSRIARTRSEEEPPYNISGVSYMDPSCSNGDSEPPAEAMAVGPYTHIPATQSEDGYQRWPGSQSEDGYQPWPSDDGDYQNPVNTGDASPDIYPYLDGSDGSGPIDSYSRLGDPHPNSADSSAPIGSYSTFAHRNGSSSPSGADHSGPIDSYSRFTADQPDGSGESAQFDNDDDDDDLAQILYGTGHGDPRHRRPDDDADDGRGGPNSGWIFSAELPPGPNVPLLNKKKEDSPFIDRARETDSLLTTASKSGSCDSLDRTCDAFDEILNVLQKECGIGDRVDSPSDVHTELAVTNDSSKPCFVGFKIPKPVKQRTTNMSEDEEILSTPSGHCGGGVCVVRRPHVSAKFPPIVIPTVAMVTDAQNDICAVTELDKSADSDVSSGGHKYMDEDRGDRDSGIAEDVNHHSLPETMPHPLAPETLSDQCVIAPPLSAPHCDDADLPYVKL